MALTPTPDTPRAGFKSIRPKSSFAAPAIREKVIVTFVFNVYDNCDQIASESETERKSLNSLVRWRQQVIRWRQLLIQTGQFELTSLVRLRWPAASCWVAVVTIVVAAKVSRKSEQGANTRYLESLCNGIFATSSCNWLT